MTCAKHSSPRRKSSPRPSATEADQGSGFRPPDRTRILPLDVSSNITYRRPNMSAGPRLVCKGGYLDSTLPSSLGFSQVVAFDCHEQRRASTLHSWKYISLRTPATHVTRGALDEVRAAAKSSATLIARSRYSCDSRLRPPPKPSEGETTTDCRSKVAVVQIADAGAMRNGDG